MHFTNFHQFMQQSFITTKFCNLFVLFQNIKISLRSVQNSPVYPGVQTHLPSSHEPPFIQMARHDFPSLPKKKIN